MVLWVYIYKAESDDLKIGISAVDKLMSSMLLNVRFVYLRPFEIPFNAIAHKILLETLSKKSVLAWIDKHKEQTKIWLKIISENKK